MPSYSEATPAAVEGRLTDSMNCSVGPLTARPATSGLTAITGASAAAIASRMPGTEMIGPIEITGLEGPTTTVSAPASASRTSALGAARFSPSNLDPLDWRLGSLHDQELLQPAPAVRRPDARLDRLLAHRQHGGAHPERPRDLLLGGGYGPSLGHEVGSVEAGREVAVGEL